MVYLASLRNSNSDRYEHHGLALLFGEDEANKALKKSHAQLFAEWLGFRVEQQKADLDLYISGLLEDKRTVVETWLKLAPYRNLIPTTVRGVERAALYQRPDGAYGAAQERVRGRRDGSRRVAIPITWPTKSMSEGYL